MIKPTGSKVRCSKCHHIFIVYLTEDPMESELNDRKTSTEQTKASNESFDKQTDTVGSLDAFAGNINPNIESNRKEISVIAKSKIYNIPSNFGPSILDELVDIENAPEDKESIEETLDDLDIDPDDKIPSIENFDKQSSDSFVEDVEYGNLPDLSDIDDIIDWVDVPDSKKSHNSENPV